MSGLAGRRIAISVSDAPDRLRLGLPAREVDRALFSICTVLVREGCEIVYAGNLDPSGYTFKVFRHLVGAYASCREAPFLHIVPEPVVRRTNFSNLLSTLRENRSVARTLLSFGEELVPVRSTDRGLRLGDPGDRAVATNDLDFAAWLDVRPIMEPAAAFTAARTSSSALADGRVALGGKMGVLADCGDRYEGAMPGIAEEALLALRADKPFVPLGAFGGATRDVAIGLGLLPRAAEVPRGEQSPSYRSAMDEVATLRSRIPERLRPALAALADDDRGEPLAYDLAKIIATWLGPT